jgi:hypothetical protein
VEISHEAATPTSAGSPSVERASQARHAPRLRPYVDAHRWPERDSKKGDKERLALKAPLNADIVLASVRGFAAAG